MFKDFIEVCYVMGKLKGQVAIITGASRGIGKAIAINLAKEDATVIVNYVKQKKQAEKVVELIKKNGGTASIFQADVSNQKEVENMIQSVINKFNKIDILINNAGIMIHSNPLAFSENEIENMVGINIKGVIHCIKSVAPEMIKHKSGKIINISSIAGLGTASPGTTIYAATKGAINVLTKRFALEFGSYGINVNAIAPGLVKTDIIFNSIPSNKIEEFIKYCKESTMLKRVGDPQDIANTATFLASKESDFITGQVITVDGGRIDFLSHSL